MINISSPAAFQGKPGYTAYTASKAAVDGMTKCLAQEWGRMGITITRCNGFPVLTFRRSDHTMQVKELH